MKMPPNVWALVLLGSWLGVFVVMATLCNPGHVGWQGASPPKVEVGRTPAYSAQPDTSVPAPVSASAQPGHAGGAAVSDGGLVPMLPAEELTWTFEVPRLGRIDVVVMMPPRRVTDRFPMLIALHGRGEAQRGPVRGARGWVDDYALPRATQRLVAPPLTAKDFEGFVTQERLQAINQELSRRPYRGLVVLCPYTVDVLAGDRPFDSVKPYAQFLLEELVPRAKGSLPVLGQPSDLGIDGVSLGGRVAVLSGLLHPTAFGAAAGLQAAFDADDAPSLAKLATVARAKNPRLTLGLLTSDGDFFLRANRAISAELRRYGIDHRFLVVPGPHDYAFNRGPGVLEMLLFHDRVLRSEPPI